MHIIIFSRKIKVRLTSGQSKTMTTCACFTHPGQKRRCVFGLVHEGGALSFLELQQDRQIHSYRGHLHRNRFVIGKSMPMFLYLEAPV